jgi:hypothetical protein
VRALPTQAGQQKDAGSAGGRWKLLNRRASLGR